MIQLSARAQDSSTCTYIRTANKPLFCSFAHHSDTYPVNQLPTLPIISSDLSSQAASSRPYTRPRDSTICRVILRTVTWSLEQSRGPLSSHGISRAVTWSFISHGIPRQSRDLSSSHVIPWAVTGLFEQSRDISTVTWSLEQSRDPSTVTGSFDNHGIPRHSRDLSSSHVMSRAVTQSYEYWRDYMAVQ